MFNKLYILPLLGSVCFSGVSPLAAMEDNGENDKFSMSRSGSPTPQREKQPLTMLPLERDTFEETVEEIHEFINQKIIYSQLKVEKFKKIYEMHKAKKRKEARTKFEELCGHDTFSDNSQIALKHILELREIHLGFIELAKDFQGALYQKKEGIFNYPRDAIGASLIARDTVDNLRKLISTKSAIEKFGFSGMLQGYLIEALTDEIGFYTYLQKLVSPFYAKEWSEDRQRFMEQVRAYRLSYNTKVTPLIKEEPKDQENEKTLKKRRQRSRKNAGGFLLVHPLQMIQAGVSPLLMKRMPSLKQKISSRPRRKSLTF
jgi:hypothetical protein